MLIYERFGTIPPSFSENENSQRKKSGGKEQKTQSRRRLIEELLNEAFSNRNSDFNEEPVLE